MSSAFLHRLSAARNTGIQNARTGIIVPLDADDLIEPTYLEVLYFALEKNPGAAWAYSDSVGFGAHGNRPYAAKAGGAMWTSPFPSACASRRRSAKRSFHNNY